MGDGKSLFTQGPWIVDTAWPNNRFPSCEIISGAIGKPDEHRALANVVVVVGGEPYRQGIANANLIAAAPDLYLALEKARWLLRAICGTDGNYPDEREILQECTSALAKARGE